MDCPKCAYVMSDLDLECPRCKRMGEQAVGQQPEAQEKAAQHGSPEGHAHDPPPRIQRDHNRTFMVALVGGCLFTIVIAAALLLPRMDIYPHITYITGEVLSFNGKKMAS